MRTRRLGITLLLLAIPGLAAARAEDATPEKQLLALEEARREAIRKQDFGALERIYSPDFVAVAGNGQVIGRDQLFAAFRRNDPSIAFTTDEIRVEVHGDTAIFIGRLTGRKDGAVISDARFTHVFIRQGSEWRCIAGQSTPLPAAAPRE
jgi:ketosteroid isomerase-like protein